MCQGQEYFKNYLRDLITKIELGVKSLYMLLDTDNFDLITKIPTEESNFKEPSILEMCEQGVTQDQI